MSKQLLPILLVCISGIVNNVFAEPNVHEEPRLYRSPEERREAGLGRQVTDWLKLSGLIELEKNYYQYETTDNTHTDNEKPVTSLQLAFEIAMLDGLTAEVILESEYDFDKDNADKQLNTRWDEAFIEAELDSWSLKIGLQYYPFGEYYSHMATDPFLEFGETSALGLITDYDVNDNLELSGYIFESRFDQQNKNDPVDWGARLEWVADDESIRLGLSYLSDLSESDYDFLADYSHQYQQRVAAWNSYALIGFDDFEITAEWINAKGQFVEFDVGERSPSAYNLELAYFLSHQLQIASRIEQSNELSEQASNRYGLSVTWAPDNHINITTEYLYGKFKDKTNDEDESLKNESIIAVVVALEF